MQETGLSGAREDHLDGSVKKMELANKLQQRRRSPRRLTIRQAADKAGVAPATYWRAEHGDPPRDMEVLTKLCRFLEISLSQVLDDGEQSNEDQHSSGLTTLDAIEVHLRADKLLDSETADSLSEAFRRMYEISIRAGGSRPDD